MSDKSLQTAIENFAKDCKFTPDSIKSLFIAAAIIDIETEITKDDVNDAIRKISKDKKGLDFAGLKKCIITLAKEKDVEPNELTKKLAKCLNKLSKETMPIDVGFEIAKDNAKE